MNPKDLKRINLLYKKIVIPLKLKIKKQILANKEMKTNKSTKPSCHKPSKWFIKWVAWVDIQAFHRFLWWVDTIMPPQPFGEVFQVIGLGYQVNIF